jgi:hypothetical protein
MDHCRLGNGHPDDSINDGWTDLKHVVPLLQQEATQALPPEDGLLLRVLFEFSGLPKPVRWNVWLAIFSVDDKGFVFLVMNGKNV